MTGERIQKQRSCIEKQNLGESRAHKTAQVMRRMQGESADELRAYPCSFGSHWHIGHSALHSVFEAADETALPQPQNVQQLSVEEMHKRARELRE